MQAFITIVSYYALLLLIMPPAVTAGIETMIMILLGPILIIRNAPWQKYRKLAKTSILMSILFAIYLGYRFHVRWTTTDIYLSIYAILPIPNSLYMALIQFATVCGTVSATYFCSILLEQARNIIFRSGKAQMLKRNLWCFLLTAGATVMFSQIMASTDILSMGYFKFICATFILFSLSVIVYCLCGSITVSIALCTGIFMVISTINLYVYLFRNRLFDPIDILSAGTAMNVLSNYTVTSALPTLAVCWGGWLSLLIIIARSGPVTQGHISVQKRFVLSGFCIGITILLFYYASSLPSYRWKNQGAIYHGYVLNYISKIKEVCIDKPSGYDPKEIHTLSSLYAATPSGEDKEPPHIIVIMDEAFSDLNVLGQLQTNKEVLPFISNLRENVISGYALTSVHGGNTANSEYEFLTGNSMAWLLPNAVPYQQYVTAPAYSMVSYLKGIYNYQCIAMHPYSSSGWSRTEVYPNFGFDEWYFQEAFPQQHFVRTYISDLEMFQTITNTYEARKENPLFLFGVTMQNHGGYTYVGDNFVQEISLKQYEKTYSDVEQYLSLIHETDKAVEYLISYFKNVEEDVVIVFFGDHQPNISEQFYEELAGDLTKSLNDLQKQYLVPFFIWANYDIAEQDTGVISLNYLSSYVYQAAGIPLSPYNQFLSKMEAVIPAINAYGFYSAASECYLPFDKASDEEQAWLQLYEQLQYNNVFDKKNCDSNFFPVWGQ